MKTSRLFLLTAMLAAPTLPAQSTGLRASFLAPEPSTRPGCYWYWINDNINKEGITKDLEAMARVGIGRAYIGHIFTYDLTYNPPRDTPVGDVKFMSDAWWEAVQWAVKEGGRCGVDIGFFNSPGWSQSGGPWVKPNQSMRYIDAGTTFITGGRHVEQKLALPRIHTFPEKGGKRRMRGVGPDFTEKDFQDVSVFAFPRPQGIDLDMRSIPATSPTLKPLDALFDNSPGTSLKITRKSQVITFTLDGATPVQSLRIDPLGHSFTLRCAISEESNGVVTQLAQHAEQRGYLGPRREDPILIPFKQTSAKSLSVSLSSSKPLAISGLTLSGRAVLAHHIRKQLGESFPSGAPPWGSYTWPAQASPSSGIIDPSQVIDLSDKMDPDGILRWDAPPGEWIVMRSGMIPIGIQSSPTSPESAGLEVDKMSKEHVRRHFDEGMMGEFLRRTPAADRKPLKYVIADSYETGPQNWTDAFLTKFQQRFGYSPVPYLPSIDGHVVGSVEMTNRFLWDWRRLIAESIARDYVGGLREVSHENKLTLWLENYGHHGFPSEFLLYGSMTDEIGGEFWEQVDPVYNSELRTASSAAHIYGRSDVYAEAFTSNRTFRQSPASMKPLSDWAYAAGINQFILHLNIHQPDERKPGINQWFGTAFHRHNTWFEPGKAFIDYLRRGSVLLKTGRSVADVAYYIGESAPVMTGAQIPKLPLGHDFDFINSDALIHRAQVVEGRIALDHGPAYAVLVLPPKSAMRPEVAKTIQRLVRDGATVVGPKPTGSPSLAGYPACDDQVRAIADEVWGEVDGGKTQRHAYGKGAIYLGASLEEVFSDMKLTPDVLVEDSPGLRCAAAGARDSLANRKGNPGIGIGKKGGIVFTHRTAPEQEVYFLSNTSDQTATFTASLRVNGRQPELWNASSGEIRTATAFTQKEGRTLIPLRLAPSESVFVVLTESIGTDASGQTPTNDPDMETLMELQGPWTLRFEGRDAPTETTFAALVDWSKHPEPSIRHYSGTAIYQTRFNLADIPDGNRILLSLGDVGMIAKVFVNGSEAGTAWSPPWEIHLGGHLQPGENTLEIHVTNTWNNRLVADASLPAHQRQTYLTEGHKFTPKSPLLKSGLIGPVILRKSKGR